MLRDNLFNRLFRSEARSNGITRVVSNAPDAPETTIEHADQIRGIAIEDGGLMAASDPYDPPTSQTLEDISSAYWDAHRRLSDIQEQRGGGLFYNPNSYITYTTSPMQDVSERLDRLDQLEKAITDMLVRRVRAFKKHGSTDQKIVDYGVKLAELFKELYPALYEMAMRNAELIDDTDISTDN